MSKPYKILCLATFNTAEELLIWVKENSNDMILEGMNILYDGQRYQLFYFQWTYDYD